MPFPISKSREGISRPIADHSLMFFYPFELRSGEDPDGLQIQSTRRTDANPPIRWTNS